MSAKIPRSRSPYKSVEFGDAVFTIGAEASNVKNVLCQLKDDNGQNLARQVFVEVMLATTVAGGVAPTAPSGAVAIGTYGTIRNSFTAKVHLQILTDSQGRFDLNITESGAYTCYLIVKFPDGTYEASDAITFV